MSITVREATPEMGTGPLQAGGGVVRNTSSGSSPLRVLVVDHDPLMSWSLATTLDDRGDIAVETSTGAAAVNALSDAPFDVVLLEYPLPDVTNFTLLSTLRQRWPASRVIVMSADFTPELATRALALGASRVIGKPLDIREIAALAHDVAACVVDQRPA